MLNNSGPIPAQCILLTVEHYGSLSLPERVLRDALVGAEVSLGQVLDGEGRLELVGGVMVLARLQGNKQN